jgi:acetyl-CoA C-acetyltransferase
MSSLPVTKIGSHVMKEAISRAGLNGEDVQEVFMGNVLTANVGQAPARQAALGAGIPNTVPATTVNKVCASGMKSIMLGAQSIMLGDSDIIVAGGMESMSNTPYYLPKARWGQRLGHGEVVDGVIRDGLWDPYHDYHMGNAGELCASECGFSREDQDAYAIESYNRAKKATEAGWFKDEIAPVEIPQRKGDPVIFDTDEDFSKINLDKVSKLRPAFQKDGTITAANASNLDDGAAAVVIMSAERAEKLGIKPIARIRSFADAAQAPEWFTTTPAKAMPKAMDKAGVKADEVDAFEINEAFSVVSLANMKELGISHDKTNVFGGAVSIGHPIGCSGARIVITLTSVLKQRGGKIGCAGICNGGGGASAMVLEMV